MPIPATVSLMIRLPRQAEGRFPFVSIRRHNIIPNETDNLSRYTVIGRTISILMVPLPFVNEIKNVKVCREQGRNDKLQR
jgi:hypothetical protein